MFKIELLLFQGFGFAIASKTDSSEHVVNSVEAGSPAKHAGLCYGDMVMAVNGRSVKYRTHEDVRDLMTSYQNHVELVVATPTAPVPWMESADQPGPPRMQRPTGIRSPGGLLGQAPGRVVTCVYFVSAWGGGYWDSVP